MQCERQRLDHELHMAHSDRGSVAGVGETDREHHGGADASGEFIWSLG